jgi:hypothetical protein
VPVLPDGLHAAGRRRRRKSNLKRKSRGRGAGDRPQGKKIPTHPTRRKRPKNRPDGGAGLEKRKKRMRTSRVRGDGEPSGTR